MSASQSTTPGAPGGKTPTAPQKYLPSSAVMGTYARQDLVFARGEGSWLYTTSGERYLDFGSGVAVNSLGHAHPRLIRALTAQAAKLWHTSNLYRVEGQEELAERLCALTFAERAFFCNSGAEACEGAIKIARRYQFVSGRPERNRIITFKGAFHGRTLATLAAAGNEKYLEGFGPEAGGFDHVEFGDHDALQAAIGPETAAIMIEPIQGEGGVRAVPPQCLQGIRELCDRHGLLLVLDEVQSGVGRTGKLFAHEWAGIVPDVMAIAKGLESEKSEQILASVMDIYARNGSDENNDFFVKKADKFSGYEKIGFVSMYGTFLQKVKKDETVNAGALLIAAIAKEEKTNKYLIYFAQKSIKDLEKMYEEKENKAVQKLKELKAANSTAIGIAELEVEIEHAKIQKQQIAEIANGIQ